MEVEQLPDHLDAPVILATLLSEFGAVTDYCTLRDTLPQKLASLLRCRCVLLYQCLGKTLQFVAGGCAEQAGWSTTLLTVAHINPIEMQAESPEAQAWRTKHTLVGKLDGVENTLVYTPLIYRQHVIGVLVALRGASSDPLALANAWLPQELALVAVVANVVAILLENTRLLERDQQRIRELALLNSITSQMNGALRERARVQRIVLQRAKEISTADFCEVLLSHTANENCTWLLPELQVLLFKHWKNLEHTAPLILERVSETQTDGYLGYLSAHIKTFFALPLSGNSGYQRAHVNGDLCGWHEPHRADEPSIQVFGVLVGAYETPRKLLREELVLLQILANQASTVLENIALIDDVIAARNEARRLLHQILDDQRTTALILESIPSGLITIDIHGKITTFNRAAEAVLGYHPREVIGQPAHAILDLHHLEQVWKTGQPQQETLLTHRRQGQEVALDVTLAPLRDDRGGQIGVLATFADMTSMHQLAEETRRLDRLASLGKMSASVAHEVRNPLASIKTSMQILLDDWEQSTTRQTDESTREAVSVVLKEVERLDGIVRDLLLFARPRHLHLMECNLLALSARLLQTLQPQCADHNVRVHLVQQDIPCISVDIAQIEQVLLNIFLNAIQAMPDGGILSVSCQAVQATSLLQSEPLARSGSTFGSAGRLAPTLDNRTIFEYSPVVDPISTPSTEDVPPISTHQEGSLAQREHAAWLELSISDTGAGITQNELKRIFQPFYTTKAHGIGLGLPISQRLIEDHHGSLLVESQLGYGTTVLVRLPLNKV